MSHIYLDWAASAPPYEDLALEAARLSLDCYANPSSLHAAGRAAAAKLEGARAAFARALGCQAGHIVWCSGGSEADSIILLWALAARAAQAGGHGGGLTGSGAHASGGSILISAIEHSAVHEQALALERFGFKVIRVRPGKDGLVKPESVTEALCDDTVLVSIMAVNNETGAVQPLSDIVKAVRAAKPVRTPLIHSDAVQALGKIPFRPLELGLDAASFSAHKLGGPRGMGALFVAKPLSPLAKGGGQEGGQRPGTQNLAGAWAFAQAAARAVEALPESQAQLRVLEARLLAGIRAIPGARVLPDAREAGSPLYSPGIVLAAFPGLAAETMVRALDDRGIAVSAGSACAKASKERRVLDAMGVPRDLSFGSIRVSLGRDSTEGDVEAFLAAAAELYARYRI